MWIVLDSSALLALLFKEPAGDSVRGFLPMALISTVNLAEVLTKVAERIGSADIGRAMVSDLRLSIEPVSEDHALTAAHLRLSTRAAGLSLGDRLCLALALERGLPVLTADRAWSRINVGVEIRLIR